MAWVVITSSVLIRFTTAAFLRTNKMYLEGFETVVREEKEVILVTSNVYKYGRVLLNVELFGYFV